MLSQTMHHTQVGAITIFLKLACDQCLLNVSSSTVQDTSADMVVACCRFLCYFCRTGRVNQRAMFEHLGYLLDNSCMLLCTNALCYFITYCGLRISAPSWNVLLSTPFPSLPSLLRLLSEMETFCNEKLIANILLLYVQQSRYWDFGPEKYYVNCYELSFMDQESFCLAYVRSEVEGSSQEI